MHAGLNQIFVRRRGSSYILHGVCVDDIIHATDDVKYFQEFRAKLASQHGITSSDNVTSFLGVQIEQDRENGTIKLHQQKYIEQVLKVLDWKKGHKGKISQTPMLTNQQLTKSDCPSVPVQERIDEYRNMVGSLNYLACWTQPDICSQEGVIIHPSWSMCR